MSDLGIFFLLWSGIELGGGLLLRGFDRFSADVILPLVQLLSASVLLRSNRSCARCIGGSCFFRWLLFDVCALSESDFVISEGGRSNRAAPVLSGILVGVLGVWLTPAIVLGIFSGLVLTAFLAAVPEAILTLILFVLPFLNALSHPTWILCGVLFLGLTVCFGKAISGKRQFAWKDVDLLAIWLGVLFIFGGVVSHGSAIDGLRRGFLMLSAWLLTRLLLQSPIWRRRGALGLICSCLICSCLGILEYVMGNAKLQWIDVSRFGDVGGRVCGFFRNPNLFAEFLLLTLPLCLWFLFSSDTALKKWASLLAFAVGSLCLVLTWSRGAWLGWILSVGVFLALCSRRSFSVLLVSVPLSMGFIAYLPSAVLRRFQSIGNVGDSSANYRVYTWRGVMRMLGVHPWGIGCGESAFRQVYPRYAVSGTEGVMHAHQIFLEVFTELGVAGLLVFLWLLWKMLRGSVSLLAAAGEGRRRAESVSIVCLLTGGLLMGLFDSLWYHNGLFWLFWCFFAWLVNLFGEGERV